MHCRAIFNCGCFRLFCERRDFVAMFWSIFLVITAKQDQSGSFFCSIYYVNDFLIDFLRRSRSPDRLDGNENCMFRHPLRLLEENFSRPDSYLRCPGRPLGSSLAVGVFMFRHSKFLAKIAK